MKVRIVRRSNPNTAQVHETHVPVPVRLPTGYVEMTIATSEGTATIALNMSEVRELTSNLRRTLGE